MPKIIPNSSFFFSSWLFFLIFKHPIIELGFSSGLFWGIFLVASSPSFSSGSCEVIVHNATPSYKQLPVGSELKDWNKSFGGSKMWSVGSLFVAVHKNQTRWISHLEPLKTLQRHVPPKKLEFLGSGFKKTRVRVNSDGLCPFQPWHMTCFNSDRNVP